MLCCNIDMFVIWQTQSSREVQQQVALGVVCNLEDVSVPLCDITKGWFQKLCILWKLEQAKEVKCGLFSWGGSGEVGYIINFN